MFNFFFLDTYLTNILTSCSYLISFAYISFYPFQSHIISLYFFLSAHISYYLLLSHNLSLYISLSAYISYNLLKSRSICSYFILSPYISYYRSLILSIINQCYRDQANSHKIIGQHQSVKVTSVSR